LKGDEEETQDEYLTKEDKGEMLILRQVLSNQMSEKDEQRENNFHSRCTVQGKVCSLIIDGGSCTNVISNIMIKKLNLQTSTHPHPYSI